MWDKIDMQDEEMSEYGKKIKTKGYMTLSDIIEIYFACNEDHTKDENDSFNERKDRAFNKFSGDFKRIKNLFDLNDSIFQRRGSHKGYYLSYIEAVFIRELYIRVNTCEVWNEIITIRRTEGEGFYKAYKETKNKKEFFEELTFFIDQIVNVVRKMNCSDGDGMAESQALKMHLYEVTQYQIIQAHKPIYDVQLKIYESIDDLHQLIDTFQQLSPSYISKLRNKIYHDYTQAMVVLESGIDNEIFRFRATMAESILENFVTRKTDGGIFQNKAILQKIVDNMKNISPALYSKLTTKNIYRYLHDIRENRQEYISIYIEDKMEKNPGWEETIIWDYEIQTHLFQAINKLNEEELQLLEQELQLPKEG